MEEKLRTVGTLFANHFTAHLDTVRLRTGRTTERLKVDHPEASAVIPFLNQHKILMVRQWRYAIGEETLEIPAGKVDPGESAEACANRELLEETGYLASLVVPVFSYYPAIGYSNEIIRIFAASGLRHISREQDIDEISGVEALSLATVQDHILQGRIRDGKTVIGLSVFRMLLEDGRIPQSFFA